MKETDVARPVVAWLQAQHWEVYQEVQLRAGIADIVAVMDRRVWIFEAKTSLSLAVLAQADRWRPYAHWSSVVVPVRIRGYDCRQFAQNVCRDRGIGIIEVYPRQEWHDPFELVAASLNRKALATGILKSLREQHKTYAEAGSANGRHWTPFKQTCRDVLVYVYDHPGCILKELIDKVSTHYASKSGARASLSHWAQAGKIPGIRTEHDGRFLRFYTETKP